MEERIILKLLQAWGVFKIIDSGGRYRTEIIRVNVLPLILKHR